MSQVHALRDSHTHIDSLHQEKPLIAMVQAILLMALPVREREAMEREIAALHAGGATVKSCHHRRLESASMGTLLTPARRQLVGELAEAADCLARLDRWAFRISHATWYAHRGRCIMMASTLLIKFQILILRNVPLTKKCGGEEKPRNLYGQFWHQLSHLIAELKRACPSLVMTEWMEMLWGPLRRLTLGTSSRKEAHAAWNMAIRTQVCSAYG